MGIDLQGRFDCTVVSALPAGPFVVVECEMGGAMWHTLLEHGTAGLAIDELDTDKPDRVLSPIPTSAYRLSLAPGVIQRAYPVVAGDLSNLDDKLDGSLMTVHVELVTLTLLDLRDWSEGFGGSFTSVGKRPNPLPIASFSWVPSALEVTFTDASIGVALVSWAWDFGDTNSSTTKSPVHTYASAGSYAVSLTVTDDVGNTAMITDEVTV